MPIGTSYGVGLRNLSGVASKHIQNTVYLDSGRKHPPSRHGCLQQIQFVRVEFLVLVGKISQIFLRNKKNKEEHITALTLPCHLSTPLSHTYSCLTTPMSCTGMIRRMNRVWSTLMGTRGAVAANFTVWRVSFEACFWHGRAQETEVQEASAIRSIPDKYKQVSFPDKSTATDT